MGFTSKIDARMVSILLVAIVGGVVGGYISNATMSNTQMEGLSNALTTQLVSKDTEIAALRSSISALKAQVSQLESTVAVMESVSVIGFNTPDFDSGWVEFEIDEHGQTGAWVEHNLGSSNLFVCLLGSEGGDAPVHQMSVGEGVYWHTYDDNTVYIHGLPMDDPMQIYWITVRALIWVLPDSPALTTTP